MLKMQATAFQNRLKQEIIAAEKAVGSYHKLEQEISRIGGAVIERRKLAKIAVGHEVSLSYAEIDALDIYLSTRGARLSTLLDRPSLLGSFRDYNQVKICFGAKEQWTAEDPPLALTEVSNWDVRSLANMLSAIGGVRSDVLYNIDHVFLATPKEIEAMGDPDEHFKNAAWYDAVSRRPVGAIVCIGSTRACHATEVTLATMFGIPPFKRTEDPDRAAAPFLFVWSNDLYCKLPSSFAVNGESLGIDSAAANRSTLALRMFGKVWPVEDDGIRCNDFGLIAAQRTSMGIMLVLAGLTGAATYAASLLVGEVTVNLPRPENDKAAPVCLALVAAEVQRHPDRRGDVREVIGQTIVQTELWTPRTGR